MSTKFSPKFTIATAYPMMFSSDDLKYIETEMVYTISDRTYFSQQSSEASNTKQFEVNETAADLNSALEDISPQDLSIHQRLENLWRLDPLVVHPKDLKRL